MAKTVVIVDENGRLVGTTGTDHKEDSSGHYKKFSKRMLGESNNYATLDYGWNGKHKLIVSDGGEQGASIELKAAEVIVPKNLKIRGKELQTIIDDNLGLAISDAGFRASDDNVVVAVYPTSTTASDSSDEYDQPKQVCMIGLSEEFLDRISAIEAIIAGSMPPSINFWDGLKLEPASQDSNSDSDEEETVRYNLSVRIGTGLTWEGILGTRSIKVDTVNTVEKYETRPVTANAVYNAIQHGLPSMKYYLQLDENGNIQVCTDEESDSSSSE